LLNCRKHVYGNNIITITSTIEFGSYNYVVIGRNGEMIHKTIKSAKKKKINYVEISRESWMVPSVDVIVYLVHKEELVYDRLKLRFDRDSVKTVSC